MNKRSLALLGFSEQDTLLLRSLLTLSEPLLKDKWIIAPLREAEVILADSTKIMDTEFSDLAATMVTVHPAGSRLTDQLNLSRPLRVSHLVALLNRISSTPFSRVALSSVKSNPIASSHTQKLATELNPPLQEGTQENSGKGIANWLSERFDRLNWKKTPSPLPITINSPPPLRIFAHSPRAFHNPALELNERSIRRNLAQLPLLNINISIPLLIDTLHGLSDEPLPARTRLQLIDLYREPVNALFYTFGTPILRNLSPLDGWEGNPLDPGKMFIECANGYKAVILASSQAGNTPLTDDSLLTGLWRAIEQLAHVLIHAYRYYRSLPPGIFFEIQQIFRYAAYWEVENRSLRASHPGLGMDAPEGTTSISDLYKQLLLFAIADPYGLSIDHLNQALSYLVPVAGKAQLLNWRDALRKKIILDQFQSISNGLVENLFFVNLDMDHLPLPITQIDISNVNENYWILNNQPILETIYQSTTVLAEDNNEKETAELPRRLVEQLITCLRGAGQRTESRYSGKAQVTLALGILEVHRVLLGDVLSKKNSWTIVNENSKGLMINSSGQQLASVGDIVGIQRLSASVEKIWMVGVIRWLRVVNSGGMAFGIEILTGSSEAAWYISLSKNQQPCILQILPDKEEALIVPKGFYRRDINFELKRQAGLYQVTAGHLLQEEAGFDQFELI
ncbi:cyclic-di-GMP-binding protein [Gammaproteobacteria bacterium]